MNRIAITGSSGYYGTRLLRHIREVAPQVRILGLDVAPPRGSAPHEFASIDIRDPRLRNVLADFRPDTVVHLAFVVDPIHDEARMHDININGSRNLFDAVDSIQPERLLVASSATAFGAWPDNPIPLDDLAPLRGVPGFKYAQDKLQLERLVGDFADRHPQMLVSWTRPCIVYGPGVDNYLSRMQLLHPHVVLPDGHDVPQQFVHEDDLAAATWCILNRGGRGPYNLAPPDWISLTDVARETNRRTIRLPLWFINLASNVCWTLRLPMLPYPPAMNAYVRHPYVVAPNRLCRELGFQFKFSTLGALRALVASREKSAGPGRSPPPDACTSTLRRAA